MVSGYYLLMVLASLALMLGYFSIWHKHFDMHITLLFVLIPISNLGYALTANATTLETALAATKVSYIGACYLLLSLMLAVFFLCDIKLKRWLRIAFTCLSTIIYLCVLTIGQSSIFYGEVVLGSANGVTVLHKQYGPMHTVFIAMEIAYICITIFAIVYSYLRKNQVSRKNLYLLFLTEIVAAACFFGGRQVTTEIELLPIAYVFALVVYLVIAMRLSMYDVTDSAIDSLVQTGETGFASFDFNFNYLGSNAAAKDVFPLLSELTVDKPLPKNAFTDETMLYWLKAFAEDQSHSSFVYDKGESTYQITVAYLYSGRRKRGYQLFIADDTKNQQYIKLLNEFNYELQDEVEKKTAHIVEMHDNLIMSMAMMVESRDNSTGGHIRRTSEGVRLLVNEMRAAGMPGLTESFCRKVIKAAPMHDLGKIAVDDEILRKPGRFTPEEFEIMKTHAAEGARIVHEILSGTDDDEFHYIAENVAHYHHERWDGSGYPKGLAGEDIPLEARIMAIADVYDALVSKRVYKEAMSFEKADAIIMDGMGTQFDKNLEPFYVKARPKLEKYYSELP